MYGPYKQYGRMQVCLVSPNHRTTLSYSKYLMSIHLGRWLTKDEIVHHINGDSLDDRIENYEIISPGEHNKRHAKGVTMIEYICKNCGKKFSRRSGLRGVTCGRPCLYEAMRKGLL